MITSPAVMAGTVYVPSNFDHLYALSASDGSEAWRYEAMNTPVAPAVVDGGLYTGTLRTVLALR